MMISGGAGREGGGGGDRSWLVPIILKLESTFGDDSLVIIGPENQKFRDLTLSFVQCQVTERNK